MRDPIGSHERPSIVCAVAAGVRWMRTVRGFHVTLLRVPDPVLPAAWSVRWKGYALSGQAPTVTAAIEDVNGIIAAGEKAFKLRCAPSRPAVQSDLFGGDHAHP